MVVLYLVQLFSGGNADNYFNVTLVGFVGVTQNLFGEEKIG